MRTLVERRRACPVDPHIFHSDGCARTPIGRRRGEPGLLPVARFVSLRLREQHSVRARIHGRANEVLSPLQGVRVETLSIGGALEEVPVIHDLTVCG